MARQEVVTLPLASGVRSRLLSCGLRSVDALQQLGARELAEVAGLQLDDAQEVLHAARSPLARPAQPLPGWLPPTCQADSLLIQQQRALRISTSSPDLDQLLGGGVACGRVIEFCGGPGVGKTQLGIQLAINAQLPLELGGSGGAAVYIDTEGSFVADRAATIAAASVRAQHAVQAGHRAAAAASAAAPTPTVDAVMANIHVMRARDTAEQVAALQLLDRFLTAHPEVRVVVVDSVTSHFRAEVRDAGWRARVLTGMAQACMAAAEAHNVAVVYMNQVSTRVMDREAGAPDAAHLVPALGESWGHAASTRVILHWRGHDRFAFLHKSPDLPCGYASYAITAEGVRSGVAGHAQQ